MHNVSDEEINLIDIFLVLWKRKVLIVLLTLIITLAAAGISLLLPKVFEVSAILEPGFRSITDANGQIVEEVPLVSPEKIKELILGGAFNVPIKKKLDIAANDC